MKTRIALTLAGSALAIVALAGCANMSSGGSSTTSPSSSSSSSSSTAGANAAVASTGLGQVIVDGKGMTAYVYDNDKANATSSACSGACAAIWTAITSPSSTPNVSGVTGKIATIKGVEGGNQITVNGLPIYTFTGDKAKGDTNGQGVMGIWWALTPSGDKVTSTSGGNSGY